MDLKLKYLKPYVSTKSTKYMDVHLDVDLSWTIHYDKLFPKFKRANGMLAKAWHHLTDVGCYYKQSKQNWKIANKLCQYLYFPDLKVHYDPIFVISAY